jgi:hypothetical protein
MESNRAHVQKKYFHRLALQNGALPVGGLIITWAGNSDVNIFADIVGRVVATSA